MGTRRGRNMAARRGPTMMQLDQRELATVLAALRYWQRLLERGSSISQQVTSDAIATDDGQVEPLTADEIDALCERINERPAAG